MVTRVRLKQKQNPKPKQNKTTPHTKTNKVKNQPTKTKTKTTTKTIFKSQEYGPLLRGGIKSRHTKYHKEDGGWANPKNTLPKLLPGPSQEPSAHQRPSPADTEEDTGTGQVGTQDKDS